MKFSDSIGLKFAGLSWAGPTGGGRGVRAGLVALVGALLAVFAVHPILELLHLWRMEGKVDGVFTLKAMANVFSPEMWGMNVVVGILGAVAAWGIDHTLRRNQDAESRNVKNATELQKLIEQGETDHLEFKSSLRWDHRQGKVNKALEAVIAKTLCGLMNHRGGTLLIGVDDEGQVLGIDQDYATLRQPDADGFEQRLVTLVTHHLGGHHTNALQTRFIKVGGEEVAVVQVFPRNEAVFCTNGVEGRYYLRTGNSTRELDTREALAHIRERGIR